MAKFCQMYHISNTRVFLLGDWREESHSSPTWKNHPSSRLPHSSLPINFLFPSNQKSTLPKLNKTFQVNFILIYVQYSQNAVFSFESNKVQIIKITPPQVLSTH